MEDPVSQPKSQHRHLHLVDSAPGASASAKAAERDGDGSETLEQAYLQHYEELKAFLHRRTGNPQAADELAHDLWIQISTRKNDAPVDNPDAWLRRVAINLAINWLKRNAYRSGFYDRDIDAAGLLEDRADIERALHARRGLEHLQQLIDELPPRRRAVFLLYRGQGLSLRETAQELGISVKTVKAQMTEALKFLRHRMNDAGLWP